MFFNTISALVQKSVSVGGAFVKVQANGEELREELEACAVTSNLLMNAVAKQGYVDVDSQISS
jgi:hypothetical protein